MTIIMILTSNLMVIYIALKKRMLAWLPQFHSKVGCLWSQAILDNHYYAWLSISSEWYH